MIRVRQSLILLLVLVTLVATGCDLGITVQEMPGETGTLVIQLKDMTRDISINWEPEGIPMDIASYEISGAGPEGRTFAETLSDPNELVVVPNLRKGDWTITVLGLNENGIAVGEGSTKVVIVAGTTTPAHVSVREIAGEGTLSVEIAWPKAEVANPNILMTLKKSTSETTRSHSFSSKDTDIPGLATLTMDIDAGYYEVTVSIYDGPTTDINNKITGVNGTANILAGKETEGTVTFSEASLRVFGDVKIFITNDMAVPFTVNLTQDRDTTWEGQPITFNATVDLEGDYTYVWYLDGDRLEDETSQQLVLDSTSLPLGTHFIGVMASRAGVLSSALTSFVVREEPDTYFTIKFLDTVTKNVVQKLDLKYSVSNIAVPQHTENFESADFSSLEYRETHLLNDSNYIIDGFMAFISNRILSNDDIESMTTGLPTNFTFAELFISDFNGAGQYPIYKQDDDKEDNWSVFLLMSDELTTREGDVDVLSAFHSSETGGTATITKYGDIGDYIIGTVELINVPLEFYDIDDDISYTEYYDILAEFSLLRAEDLQLNFTTMTFVINDERTWTDDFIIGEAYTWILDERHVPTGETQFIGWSTEPDGQGTVYYVGGSIIIPEGGMTLYAVWGDNIP